MTNEEPGVWQPWLALALCFIATIIIFVPYVGYSTQTPQIMSELRMDYTMVGTMASATALAGGIVVFIAGSLLERWGAKRVCLFGLIASAIGQFVFANVHTYHMMLIVRIFQGGAIPLLFVGPYTIAMQWAAGSRKMGVFMGVMMATDGIGTVVATYGYSAVLTGLGWRHGSLWGGVALGVVAIIIWAFLKEPAKPSAAIGAGSVAAPSQLHGLLLVMREPDVIIACLAVIGVWGSLAVAVFWVPTLLIEAGWSDAQAGFIGALYPLAGTVSAVSFGLISDRLGHRKLLMFISGAGMVIAFVGAAIAVDLHRFDLLAICLPISGLFAYGGLPVVYCVAGDAVGIDLAGTALGCIMGTGMVLGGVIYPLILGYIRDATGLYTIGFIAAAVSLFFFNFVAVFFVKEAKPGSHASDNLLAVTNAQLSGS